MNMRVHIDSEVHSHLIKFGFVKDYTVWTFHGEKVDATGGASGGNSLLLTTVNIDHVGRQPASSLVAAASDDNAHDYITMEDLFQDMAADDDSGGDADEEAIVRDLEGAELLEEIANRIDEDDILYGSPRWLENFRDMKQAAIDPLYKDYPKHWTALRFNLQMLMLKAQHGWSDTSFNELLSVLANTYPKDNEVPTNTYRAKKLIRPVAMKLRKFDACPNHCILYRGEQYDRLESCSHYSVSRYKRNTGCCVDANNYGALGGPKKKGAKKKGRRRSRSCLNRTRKKRDTCRGKVLHCQYGTCLSLIVYELYSRTPRMPS
jgi:hypothetical protein